MTNELDAGRAIEILEDDELEQANEAMGKSLFDQAAAILQGIDAEESANANGWWETSEGAKFGAEKLRELRALLDGCASLPVGVPDGFREAQVVGFKPGMGEVTLHVGRLPEWLDMGHTCYVSAAPTVKAEQVPSCTKPDCFPYCDCGGIDDPVKQASSLPAAGSAVEEAGSRVDRLLDEAFRLLQHDTGEQDVEYRWQRQVLRENFQRILGVSVSAQQPAPTPEFVWVRLLEALAGDNGCAFTASTDDYREAKPALVELIAAGFFRDSADSLDGDIWMVAAGEEGEAKARFDACSHSYANLSAVLNRVFERPAGGE